MKTFTEKLAQMAGRRVYIDTNILIFFFNQEALYFERVRQLVNDCASRKILGVISELVVAELLVQPYRHRNMEAITLIKSFCGQNNFLHVEEHEKGFIYEAAMLAGERGLKLVDAIHLHTALATRCDFLLTHDGGFKSTPSLEVVQLGEYV